MATKVSQKRHTKRTPICKAILLCDQVIRDEATHKSSVIGIFDTALVASFPGPTPPCKIFLLLAGGVGSYSITAEVHDPKLGVVLFRSPAVGEIGGHEKPAQGELWLPVAALMFERPGTYEMVVFADGVEIAPTPFKVKTQ